MSLRIHPALPVDFLRVLFHNNRLLHPLNGGDRIRTYNMLRELRKRHHVTYLCRRTPQDAADATALATEYCHELVAVDHPVQKRRSLPYYGRVIANTLWGKYPFHSWQFYSPSTIERLADLTTGEGSASFDLLICDYLAPVVNLLELKKRPALPIMLFQHNVESVIFRRHAATESNPLKAAIYRRQWGLMRELEDRAAAFVDSQVAVSESDLNLFRSFGMQNVIGAVPTGVDCEYFQPPQSPPAKPVLAFLGAMDWDANRDAVQWFVAEIWPKIRAAVPAAELLLIGRNPPADLRELSAQDSGIRVTGTVPDVRPHMAEALAMVLPLRIGGGTRIKVYEAMAMGSVVISTSIGVEGLDVTHGRNVLLADEAEEFAREAIQLLTSPALAAQLSLEARGHVAGKYSWSRVADIFSTYCHETVGLGHQAVAKS